MPLRPNLTVLVRRTSSVSTFNLRFPEVSLGLSKTNVTLQFFAALPRLPPLNISWPTFSARRLFELLAPNTNCSASPQLDFPEPLGPVIPVKPTSNGITTSPLNDLKFSICISFRCKYPIPCFLVAKSDYEFFGGFQGTINDGGPPRAAGRFQDPNLRAVKRFIDSINNLH